MSDRKLATVRSIESLRPIPGADKIEVAVVDGWECIVQKGEFQIGGLAVFFEIDSFLPANDPRWAFLENKFITWNGQKGFRVKSIKMRGQISQGLLQKIELFQEISQQLDDLKRLHGKSEALKKVGELSFEELIGVKKYDGSQQFETETANCATSPMPSFIKKTDQPRIQNLPDAWKTYADQVFQETTKMDGSSMTAYFVRRDSSFWAALPTIDESVNPTAARPNGRFGVCSRNVDIPESPAQMGGHFWPMAKAAGLPEKMASLDRNLAIQGELCGSKIQGNFEGFPDGFRGFFVFSVWDLDTQAYLKPRDTEALAEQLGLKHVPVVGYGRLGDLAPNAQGLIRRADGIGLNGRKREGIVLKSIDGQFSFKAISNSYLLKNDQ